MRKPRIISDKIGAQLARLLYQHTQGEISDLQLAISCKNKISQKIKHYMQQYF